MSVRLGTLSAATGQLAAQGVLRHRSCAARPQHQVVERSNRASGRVVRGSLRMALKPKTAAREAMPCSERRTASGVWAELPQEANSRPPRSRGSGW